jgi:transcriptional regulator with XRE-family HTH domain
LPSHHDKILAIRLRELRKLKGLTQRQVADLADIPYETYSGYERAESQAPFTRIFNVARALGVSLDYLAGTSRDPVPARTSPQAGPTPATPPKQTP